MLFTNRWYIKWCRIRKCTNYYLKPKFEYKAHIGMGEHENNIVLNGNEHIFGWNFIVMTMNASFGSQTDWRIPLHIFIEDWNVWFWKWSLCCIFNLCLRKLNSKYLPIHILKTYVLWICLGSTLGQIKILWKE